MVEINFQEEFQMSNNIYQNCPVFSNDLLTLRLISDEDTEELLKCYSDEAAVPLFNSDNCNGDDFHYTTLERMREAVEFWKYSYENGWFVRLTVILNDTGEKIGTIEMFNRGDDPIYGSHGILRIDLMSRYERTDVVSAILKLANEHFYEPFGVDCILTKAIPSATNRIAALGAEGYTNADDFEVGPNYYFRRKHTLN